MTASEKNTQAKFRYSVGYTVRYCALKDGVRPHLVRLGVPFSLLGDVALKLVR